MGIKKKRQSYMRLKDSPVCSPWPLVLQHHMEGTATQHSKGQGTTLCMEDMLQR